MAEPALTIAVCKISPVVGIWAGNVEVADMNTSVPMASLIVATAGGLDVEGNLCPWQAIREGS